MRQCICFCRFAVSTKRHPRKAPACLLHKIIVAAETTCVVFSQLNSTCTRTSTPLPATVCQTPAAPTRRLTAEVDWITLWIFSRSWANTLANMWFINMPGATPSSVRQRADKLFKHGATIPRISAPQLRQSAGRGGGKSAVQQTTYLLYYPSVLESMIITWVSSPDLIVFTCLLLSLWWFIYYLTWLVQ